MRDSRGLGIMTWEVDKTDQTFGLPECCALFLKKNKGAFPASNLPPSVMSQRQKQSPIMQSRFVERKKEGEEEGDNSCEVFFFFF